MSNGGEQDAVIDRAAAHAEDGGIVEPSSEEQENTVHDATALTWFEFDTEQPLQKLLSSTKEFAATTLNNFTKGVKVSPDGLCILTNSEDHVLRLFELPEESQATATEQTSLLQMKEGGSVYDFAWYPFMSSQNPSSCIFISTSRDHPIHMWDAFTGGLRATYRAYDHLDEITAANAVTFNATGDKIFAGYDRMIRYFDISQPGREFVARPLCKTRKSRQGQRGIISTIHFNPDYSSIYAAGSYNGTTCIYTEDSGEEVLRLRDHGGHGITQVKFSPDGRYLFTAARRDGQIHCWDIRHTTSVVQSFSRNSETNQRIEFDVHCSGRYLVTGCRDGNALLYDIATGERLDQTQLAYSDAVNGVSFFPDGTRGRVALTTGQRHYQLPHDMDDDSNQAGDTSVLKPDRNGLHVVELGRRI